MRRPTAPGWLGAMVLLLACLPTTGGRAATPTDTSWNQWLGGAERTLARREGFDSRSLPPITERWRVPLGSGVEIRSAP